MAGISTYLAVQLLDWHLGGKAATSPAARACGLSLGVPTSVSASEMATGEGVTRQAVTYNSAVAAGMSAANSNAFTFGPFSSARTVSGLQLWNTTVSGDASQQMLWYGTLATARTLGVGDSLVFNSASLVHTLS